MGERRVLGWREWVGLPDFGIPAVRAKIDTGARSSALHVDGLETFHVDGRERVRFRLRTGEEDARLVVAEADVLDRRTVTDSGGHRTLRIFVRTTVMLGGQAFPAEINLSNRHNMSFPMLVGRTALSGLFLVDPARSWTVAGPAEERPA
ncbi:ATP-dependent zinc protease [Coralloluteibacterium thermophilus]|uniref:ATP-dependent zinc protease n=1 Tax=Coralloluteibacterium thermophilum TaxID=2707049 RepID=A0ABV9NKA1_9GAMM